MKCKKHQRKQCTICANAYEKSAGKIEKEIEKAEKKRRRKERS